MSISAIGSSSLTASYGLTGSSRSQGPDSDEIAASIVEQDDADGDGLLSLEETPLDEDRFNSIDTDGDGFISAEELSASAQANMEQQGLMGQVSMQMQGISVDEMVSNIFSTDDADGDGLLSFEETPLDEEKFNSIDADGDGFISAEELSADMTENMTQATGSAASGGAQTAQSGSGSGESSSDEDYDEYDLNQDGTVSYDELLMAMQNGDSTAASLIQAMGGGSVSSLTQQFAMQAYEAQMAV